MAEEMNKPIEQSGSGGIAAQGGVAAGAGGIAIGGNVYGNVSLTSVYDAAAASALHQLPSPPADFTGREAELAALGKKINKGVTISAIQGMGGIGKTALALKLADE